MTSVTMDQDARPDTPSERKHKMKSLSLDLSKLASLEQPAKPTNTLIITNLQSLDFFFPDSLEMIRNFISQTAPIHSFSPLKSFRRIIVSFFDVDAAINVRQQWEGEALLGEHIKVYYGTETPISAQGRRLALPDAGKLFFISPPPSPPHGWEQKLEDEPNKMVHAEDLAEALAKLHHRHAADAAAGPSPISPAQSSGFSGTRSRSSTLIFQPQVELGNSPDLPCVTVDDMTDEPMALSPLSAVEPKPLPAHTARPPVELMEQDSA